MRPWTMVVVLSACGPAGVMLDGGAGGAAGGLGSFAGGASAGGASAGGVAGGGASAGGASAGGAVGGSVGGGSASRSDAGLPVCLAARPTTSCDDEGGPSNGQSGAKGTCVADGTACQCTAPYQVNPITGRCRASPPRQPVCRRYDGIQCSTQLADGGTRPATGTCGTLTIPAGCGCEFDWSTNTFRAACTRTCLSSMLPGEVDCTMLNCGTIACLDDTRCVSQNTCR